MCPPLWLSALSQGFGEAEANKENVSLLGNRLMPPLVVRWWSWMRAELSPFLF